MNGKPTRCRQASSSAAADVCNKEGGERERERERERESVSYTHVRANEIVLDVVCPSLLDKNNETALALV